MHQGGWFHLQDYIETHGQQKITNVSKGILVCMFQGFERGNNFFSFCEDVLNVTIYFFFSLLKCTCILGDVV